MLLGYSVLANHCALAMYAAKHAVSASASCCAHKTTPTPDPQPCHEMPGGCCKTLKVTTPDAAKAPLPDFALVLPDFTASFSQPPVSLLPAAIPSTGPPPDFPSFVELVLNRSLLSHAPPVCA
jgi:hypothetical protein